MKSRIAGSLATLMSIAAMSLALGPGIASAGTSGQQLVVYGKYQWSVRVCGTNQNNAYVCGYHATPNYYSWLGGWWWKGTVRIDNYASNGAYLGTTYCNVPTYQSGSDWTYCHGIG